MKTVAKKTGTVWSKVLNIDIVNPSGWESINDYNTLYVTKDEFCNRAANSVVAPKVALSRRDAAKYARKKLSK